MLFRSRQEDLRLVTGTGRYAADWMYPGMLHAYVIRSQVAHALIRKADYSAVREAPGVVAVLTASDVAEAGFASLPNAVTNKALDGSPQKQALMPVLASDKVLFAGQPIAMVIASSARAAQDAAELAILDFEELPAVATVSDALADFDFVHPRADRVSLVLRPVARCSGRGRGIRGHRAPAWPRARRPVHHIQANRRGQIGRAHV